MLFAILVSSNFCFGQTNILVFVFDTASFQKHFEGGENSMSEYYPSDTIIHYKSFYDPAGPPKKICDEFIRVGINKYVYYHYDTLGNKRIEGLAMVDPKVVRIDSTMLVDSDGNFIKYDQYIKSYIFTKEDYWREWVSGDKYMSGNYVDGKKDSIWNEIDYWKTERQFLYHNGRLMKIDTINQVYRTNAEKEKLLCKKWALSKPTISDTVDFVKWDKQKDNCHFIEFKDDGTYVFIYCMTDQGIHVTGKWSWDSTKPNIIKMVSDKGAAIATINYIVDDWLTLIYQH